MWVKLMCNCTWALSSKNDAQFLSLVFLHFGENFLVRLERKHLDPTIYFPSSHPTKHILETLSFLFSFQSFSPTLFRLQTNTPLILHEVIAI